MSILLAVLIYVIGCLVIKTYRLKKENKIYYNNYMQSLRTLRELDPTLDAYLRRKNNGKE